MKTSVRIALAALAFAVPAAAGAQSLDDAHAAYMEAWEAAPLAARKAVFVAEPPAGYGSYLERESNVFAAEEQMLIYVEPVGYGFTGGDGGFQFGTGIDLRILAEDGAELFAEPDAMTLKLDSGGKPTEFFGTVTLDVAGLPAGKYGLELVLKDLASDETATVSMPFEVE